jgi:type IV secretion system protein VirB10
MFMKSFVNLFCLFVLAAFIALPLSAQEAAKQAPQDPEIVVPSGTVFPVVLNTYLNSRSAQVGDVFYADTTYPIWIQQRLVIPRGSIVKGVVTQVDKAGAIKGKGRIAVKFQSILLPNGVERSLVAAFHGIHGPGSEKIDRQTETVEQQPSVNKGEEIGTVIGTASEGAIIGAVTGAGAKGAGIGAGAGAATGIAIALLSRDRNLVLEPGIQLDLELRQPLRFAYGEIIFTEDQVNKALPRASAPRPRKPQPSRSSIIPRIFFPRIWR